MSAGWYKVALTTTDTNTLGDLSFHCTGATCDPTDFADQVVAFNPLNANLGLTNVSANTVQFGGQAVQLDGNNLPKVDVADWGGTAVGAISPDVVFLRSGTAQAGGASTITLDAGASAVNNFYQNAVVFLRSGTGAGQCALITTYNGTTKVATINGTWATNPDATSVFSLLPFGAISASVAGNVTVGGYAAGQDPATLVLDVSAASHNTAGTIGSKINSAGSAGDPWATLLPGSYGAGTAGNIVGNNLDAKVSTRSAPATAQTIDMTTALPGSPTAGTVGEALKQADKLTFTSTNVNANTQVNADKTGYSLTQAFPANFASLSIDSSGRVTLAPAGVDAIVVETGLNLRQAQSIIAAAMAGVLSGASTNNITIAGAGVGTTRITAVVDSNDNRTSVTLAPPA